MDFDEVRLGRSWDDVVPNDGGGGNNCPEDINGDGIVGFGDVLEAVAWGSSGMLQTLTATVPPSAMCSQCCPHSAPAKARPNS